MNRVLVAGATGYLGNYIVKNLVKREINTTVLVRNPEKFAGYGIAVDRVIEAEVTDSSTLTGCCDGIDMVVSSVGITRQSDGLSYMQVDYEANVNLLREAQKSGVKKFLYISVLNGEKLKLLGICAAKEKFVEELKHSGLDYCVIRPNGFFSDMTEFYTMAQKGRVYLFGDGSLKSNPIHGDDLAKVCIDALDSDVREIEVGGPETLSQIEIAQIAFEAVAKPVKITHIPDWVRRAVLKVLSVVLNERKFGPIEFFMNVMAMEMRAPQYGVMTLREYFANLQSKE